jgi:peptidoglycan/xylan/chitin deacetylase (PgdA/CDA1 family)
VISRDLSTPAHRDLLQRLVDADHEIANHTHTHRMDLRSCDHAALRAEIEPACARIEEAAGRPPLGFRAPGFSFHPNLPEILTELGHIYDSSLLPSPWAPALRLARRVMGGGGGQRQRPYGSFGQSFSPRGPHSVKRGRGEIVEIPVSLTPGLRLPAHASFALLRSDDAFRRTVEWHAQRRTAFVWVIHLIDLCDTLAIELPTPGWSRSLFRRAADEKRRRIGEMLRVIAGEFEIQRTDRWVQSEVHRI